MSRTPRRRTPRGESRVGARFEVEVGAVAHGGFCVARLDGRAVFVRHALPGERVVVEITEGTEGDRFWRADAVAILSADPDRVEAPCPYAGPDACGGCDFQHVTLDRQRRLKGEVVSEQLRRLAGLDLEVMVEPVPGDVGGLHWRTRQRYVELPDGGRGLRKHRSRRRRARRGVPDRGTEQPSRHVVPRDLTFDVDDRRLLAGAPGCTRGARRVACSACSRHGRGSRCSTCTPVSASSRVSWPGGR